MGLAIVTSRVLFVFGRRIRQAEKMGSWRAEHSTLARPAAIKLIRPESLTAASAESLATVLKRFEREAQATAQLSSPHTIELYDYGVADDGSFYFVMELLEGRDLEWVLARAKSLPAERVVYLLEQVCDSLRDAPRGSGHGRAHEAVSLWWCLLVTRAGSVLSLLAVVAGCQGDRRLSNEIVGTWSWKPRDEMPKSEVKEKGFPTPALEAMKLTEDGQYLFVQRIPGYDATVAGSVVPVPEEWHEWKGKWTISKGELVMAAGSDQDRWMAKRRETGWVTARDPTAWERTFKTQS